MQLSAKAAWGAGIIATTTVALGEGAIAIFAADDGHIAGLCFLLGLWAPVSIGFAALVTLLVLAADAFGSGARVRALVAAVGALGGAGATAWLLRPAGATGAPFVAASGVAAAALAWRGAGFAARLPDALWTAIAAAMPLAVWGVLASADLSPAQPLIAIPFAFVVVIAAYSVATRIPARFLAALAGRIGAPVVLGAEAALAVITIAAFDGQGPTGDFVSLHTHAGARFAALYDSVVGRTALGHARTDAESLKAAARPRSAPPPPPVRITSAPEPATASLSPAAVPPRGSLASRLNIILITVDALRADHLGCYGYSRPTSPAIDQFAASDAIRFTWAFSADTKTKPSIPALFSGRHASTLNWTRPRYVPLKAGNRLIAERLLALGYHTAGFATHTYFAKYNRLNQGFEHWDTSLVSTDDEIAFGRATSHILTDRILAYLSDPKRADKPFFLWAHYFDPHQKYLAHPEFAAFGSRTIDRYDQEIAFTDRHIGRLISALKARPDWDRTVFILTADHGEAFGEHGHRFHGETLFNEQLRVPLILRVPGRAPLESARVVDEPVSLIDVAPTILEIVGSPRDESLPGASLLARGTAGAPPRGPVFAELLPENHIQSQKAMIDGKYKLIYYEARNTFAMFNFADDVGEKKTLVKLEPDRFARMRTTLLEWIAKLPKWTDMGEP